MDSRNIKRILNANSDIIKVFYKTSKNYSSYQNIAKGKKFKASSFIEGNDTRYLGTGNKSNSSKMWISDKESTPTLELLLEPESKVDKLIIYSGYRVGSLDYVSGFKLYCDDKFMGSFKVNSHRKEIAIQEVICDKLKLVFNDEQVSIYDLEVYGEKPSKDSVGNMIWSPFIDAFNLFNGSNIKQYGYGGNAVLIGGLIISNENISKIRIKFDADKFKQIKTADNISNLSVDISDLRYPQRDFSNFITSNDNDQIQYRLNGSSDKHLLSEEKIFNNDFAKYTKVSENEYLIDVKKLESQLIKVQIIFPGQTNYSLQNFIRLYKYCDFDIKLYK